MRVWRGEKSYRIRCKLVDNESIRPILGRRACIGLNIIQYTDNDELTRPRTNGAAVFSTEEVINKQIPQPPVKLQSVEDVIGAFPEVFAKVTGAMQGEYTIRLDRNAQPVQHTPRRVPLAIRDKVCQKLKELEENGIIQQITKPTPWISSMVEVVKPNGQLRICLDPRDLNKAIQREKYPLPTIEEVATRLHGAKVFTKLDVRNGFWHIKLDEE